MESKNKDLDFNIFKEFKLKQFLIYSLVSVLILFLCLWIFTRPYIFAEFDFSDTGEIGDTIGGLTAPIINLIAAYLVYISFVAQVKANKNQFLISTQQYDVLRNEISEGNKERNYELALNLFKELKDDYYNLSLEPLKGGAALNRFITMHSKNGTSSHTTKKNTFQLLIDIKDGWEFVLFRYNLLCVHIIESELRGFEEVQISRLILKFYDIHMKSFSNYVKEITINSEEEEFYDLSKHKHLVGLIDSINEQIDQRLRSKSIELLIDKVVN